MATLPGITRPRHVSLWRERDRILIASNGPPIHFTGFADVEEKSLRELAARAPAIVTTGGGAAMKAAAICIALDAITERFDEVAVPSDRRT